MSERINLEYGQVCGIWLYGLPRPAIYTGYNSNENVHVLLARNPSNKKQIIPLSVQNLKIKESLGRFEKILTNSEEEFAIKLLETKGI